ncbi:PH domain-containing protein [Flavobacterium granuli]|uniref:Membrane protein n=1 Tax=Flavobacterium granuli TaxID=280093 RepID=A0A1M5T1H7_9FLAO|nr:PH domain-containing protein [Flavobacterium granuli]PRZ20661.1 putative membrane protein [Flavobacterium granuli]SHH44555.1 putative membrane protein [Flavobacterium granuli]
MEQQFNHPQRQSPIGVLVMFFETLQQWARGLWPVLVVYAFKFNELNKVYLFLGISVFLLIIVFVAYLKYLNFTFFLESENEEFVINEGILNKTKTIIQLNKIQQVDINQSLIQRLIGVYELNVDTAGSAKKEGKIKAISHPLALALKTRLLENDRKNQDTVMAEGFLQEEIIDPKPFIKISFLSLLKVGITSNYVKTLGLILAFLATIYENGKKFLPEDGFNKEEIGNYIDQSAVISSIVLVFFLTLSLILIINLVRVVFKYFDYQLTKQNGSLLLSFGLLSTKSTIVKPEKVQIVTLSRNYFQKKMNILEIKIKQATSSDKENNKSIIEIPGCDEKEKEAIFKLLFHSIPEKGFVLKPNYRKLVFSIVLFMLLPVIVFFTLANFIDATLFDYAFALPLYLLFVGLIVSFGYKNNRLYISDDFIIKQSGAWDIDNEIIEPGKIQAITTSQLFWHKKADIGSLIIHTAGGDVVFQLGNFTSIKQYVNLWLYRIETANNNWM